MRVPTVWDGDKLKADDSIEVDEYVARRWQLANIAELEDPSDNIVIEDAKSSGGAGSSMTLPQLERAGMPHLNKIAELRGLDISSATNNKARAKLIWDDINKE